MVPARIMREYRESTVYFCCVFITANMTHKVNTHWNGNMQFNASVNGHSVMMDAVAEAGGMDAGPRPKELMLASLAGCTGMDVVSILKKMRVAFESFDVQVEANGTDEHPRHYTRMHLTYLFTGNGLPADKLQKAVNLSQDKYCGVSFMYRKAMELTYEIRINNETINN